MSAVHATPGFVANLQSLDEAVVFDMLGNTVRRRIVATLACNGPKSAHQLAAAVGAKVAVTLKQLAALRRAGMVMMGNAGSSDRRRALYALTPAVPVIKNETGVSIQFPYCTLPNLGRIV